MEEPRDYSRREFFRQFPRELFKGFRAIAKGERSPVARLLRPSLAIDQCVAWAGLNCQACYLRCPLREKALTMVDAKPVLHLESCDGCAKCVEACRTVNDPPAILMKETEGRHF